MPSIHQLETTPSGLAQFQLRTGNINGNLELKCTNFSNSAEELAQWISLQSKDSIMDNTEDDRMAIHARNDLKVTFKIFMTKWDVGSLEKAIEALKEELKIKDIETVIVAPPPLLHIDGESEKEKLARWIDLMFPIYSRLAQYIYYSEVGAIGLADVSLRQLKKISKRVAMQPPLVQLHESSHVDPELRAFAEEQEVQLLAHVDPVPMPLAGVAHALTKITRAAGSLQTTLLGRYTVFIRARAVMISKGYIAHLEETH
ncbi:hypothetical protein B9Z55_026588 [Caenorhabditis nigoni]|nr:hypothetical protein B9Z55_026588 [Caenorhabditis nigoni]